VAHECYVLLLLLLIGVLSVNVRSFTISSVDIHLEKRNVEVISNSRVVNTSEDCVYVVEMEYEFKNVGLSPASNVTAEVFLLKNQTEWAEQRVLGEFFGLDNTPIFPVLTINENSRKAMIFVGNLSAGETKSVVVSQKVKVQSVHFDLSPKDVGTVFPDGVKKYTHPIEGLFESNSSEILELASSIIGNETNPLNKAELILESVNSYLTYEEQTEEHSALWAYYSHKGDCSDYANLFIAISRAVGIPAQIVTGIGFIPLKTAKASWTDKGLDIRLLGHAWVIIYLPNIGWLPVDAVWPIGVGAFAALDSGHIIYAVSDGEDIVTNGNILYPSPVYCEVIWLQVYPTTLNIEIRGGISPEIHLPVPYEWQDNTDWCGPACLAMILRYYGEDIHVWDIAKDIQEGGLPKHQGIHGKDLTKYVREHFPELTVKEGKYYSFKHEIWNSIESNLTFGYPAILNVNRGDEYHYIVITGFNSSGAYVNDPSGALFYWIWDKMLNSNIHVFVPWGKLEEYVRTGFDSYTGRDPTFIIIQGTPKLSKGSICIGGFSDLLYRCYIWFQDKNDRNKMLFIDFNKGLVWYNVQREVYVTSNDILNANCSIYNHNAFSEDYELLVSVVDSQDNKVVLDEKHYETTEYSNATYSHTFSDLDKLFVPNEQYEIRFELYDLSDELIDEITLPPILYEPPDLTKKYFPYLIFDEEETFYPTDFFYDDTNIWNNPSNFDEGTWPLKVYVHTVEGDWRDWAEFSFTPVYKDFIVIQYWFYYARDPKMWEEPFLGAHDNDWESVYIFLEKKEPEPEPQWVAYFHHSGGVWWSALREYQDSWDLVPWENPNYPAGAVEKVGDTHPVVHVARHSHASYPWSDDFGLCRPMHTVTVPIVSHEGVSFEELPYAEFCDGGRELDLDDFEIVLVEEPDPEWPQMFGEIPAPWGKNEDDIYIRRRWNDPSYLLRKVEKVSFIVLSPVNILVTAPDGLRIGYDPSSDTVVNEIAGHLGEEYAEYSGKDSEPQVITILDPIPGEYLVSASGTGSGEYRIVIQSVSANNTLIDTYDLNGTAYPGSQNPHEIELREDYSVIPEFPLFLIFLLFMITFLPVIVHRRRKTNSCRARYPSWSLRRS